MPKETRAIIALRGHAHAPALRGVLERAFDVDAAIYALEATAVLPATQEAALRVIRLLFEESRNDQ